MDTRRVQFIDIMRGVAVIIMVMGHSIDSVLSTEARATEAFRFYDAVRGFTAPMFLFVSGFAFTIVTERKWGEYKTFSSSLRKRLWKMLLLLTIGYALHLPYFSFPKLLHEAGPEDYARLFQVDVLHCVAAGIGILQLAVFLSRSPEMFARIALMIAGLIACVTPVVWSVDLARTVSAAVAPYFNQASASIFPVFPYATFMLSGAAASHYFLRMQRAGQERRFFAVAVALAFVVAICGFVFDLLPITFYPAHDYWRASPNFVLIRLGAVVLVTAGFFYVGKLPAAVEQPVLALGKVSLPVYACHLILVYGSPLNNGLQQVVGKTLPYTAAAAVGVAVLGGMTLLAYLWNYVRVHHVWPWRIVQAGFASTIVYLFFTNPW